MSLTTKIISVSTKTNVGLVIVVVWILLASVALMTIPAGFDESYNLNVPVNLVRFGRYASQTALGFTDFDPVISTGPTVLLPIATAFTAFGIGLLQARLVMLAFFAVFVTSLYIVTSATFGRGSALLTFLLLLFLVEPVVTVGIQVLGEIPGLLFFVFGIALWALAAGESNIKAAIGAGLLFGLAIITKSIFALVLPAIPAAYMIVQRRQEGLRLKVGLTTFACALLPLLVWVAIQVPALGFPQALPGFQSTDPAAMFALGLVKRFSFVALTERVVALGDWWQYILLLLSLIYVVISLRKSSISPAKALWLVTWILWLVWWLFISDFGWPRHLLPAQVLGVGLVAALCMESLSWIRDNSTFRRETGQHLAELVLPTRLILPVSIILLALMLSLSAINFVGGVNTWSQKKAEQDEFAAYINDNVSQEAHIYGHGWWMAWELAFLTSRDFYKLPLTPLDSSQRYIVITPHGLPYQQDDRQLQDLLQECCVVEKTIGQYTLYRLD